jgi:hypothetical protein
VFAVRSIGPLPASDSLIADSIAESIAAWHLAYHSNGDTKKFPQKHLSPTFNMPDSHADDIEKNENPFLIPPPITLSWSDLAYQVKGKKILDGVSGQLASGQLLAVMGPSGKFLFTFV